MAYLECWFLWRGGETGQPGEKPLREVENQQQTQPTYGTGSESNPGHIGGRRALLPLRHPCDKTLQRMGIGWRDEGEGDLSSGIFLFVLDHVISINIFDLFF